MMMGEQVSQINKAAELRRKKLRGNVGKAVVDYAMIEDGDKVMACVSGGKDSFVMLDALLHLQRVAQIKFSVVAVNLDQKQPGFPEHVLPDYLQSIGVPFEILEEDTYTLVKEMVPDGKTYCGWCSRFRRGILYRHAREAGFTKVALGHHRDDILETFFLNLFFGGKLKAMPPKLKSDDGENILIRPLAYCKEKDLAAYAEMEAFPIIPCNLCGSQDNLQRQVVKEMLKEWDRAYPGRSEIMFRALSDVSPSQLLDTRLHDFAGLYAEKALERLSVVQINE